ncbi:hypothetical protein [Ramlibacter sp. AN1133]|uniref:hypothetical protein n=1 Tax=Ramlibacter sp. AN1133 TaxID=3133429 RepID=UPI0030BED7CE
MNALAVMEPQSAGRPTMAMAPAPTEGFVRPVAASVAPVAPPMQSQANDGSWLECMHLEADIGRLVLPELAEMEQAAQLWMDEFECACDAADVEVLRALLAAAPNAFAKGLAYNSLKSLIRMAAVTGRPL